MRNLRSSKPKEATSLSSLLILPEGVDDVMRNRLIIAVKAFARTTGNNPQIAILVPMLLQKLQAFNSSELRPHLDDAITAFGWALAAPDELPDEPEYEPASEQDTGDDAGESAGYSHTG